MDADTEGKNRMVSLKKGTEVLTASLSKWTVEVKCKDGEYEYQNTEVLPK